MLNKDLKKPYLLLINPPVVDQFFHISPVALQSLFLIILINVSFYFHLLMKTKADEGHSLS